MKRIILGLLLSLWATIAAAQYPQDFYWQVGDTNPGTQVFSGKRGIYVALADATYVAWLAAGNIVGFIPTDATLHQVINGINQSLPFSSYDLITSASDITLSTVTSGAANPIATTLVVCPGSGNNVFLPPASAIGAPAKGQLLIIINNCGGLSQFNIKNNDGSQTVGNMLLNTSRLDCLLYDNTTLQGGWLCRNVIVQGDTIDNSSPWNGAKIGLAYGGTNADLSATGGANQFLRQNSPGAAVTVVRPACAALSDAAATCPLVSGRVQYTVTGVNFNAANTDNSVTITLPSGFSRFQVTDVTISNASHSLTTATCGLFTQSGTGGITLVASGSAITVSATTDAAPNNTQIMTLTAAASTMSFVASTLVAPNTIFFRTQNAEGAASTADVTITIRPLP